MASRLLVTRALDKDDQKLLALMTKRVGVTLRLQRLNAVVRSVKRAGAVRALGDRAINTNVDIGSTELVSLYLHLFQCSTISVHVYRNDQ